jgi:hypothetical protein
LEPKIRKSRTKQATLTRLDTQNKNHVIDK